MTDPMELVGRLEKLSALEPGWYANVGKRTGEQCCAAMSEAAACIREMVERQLPTISKDGPYEISRAGRFWLARQLLDSKLTDAEAYGIVAHHPAITDTLTPAPGAEDE